MNAIINNVEFQFVEKLRFFIEQAAPYKVAFGGRGGAKTLSLCQAALLLGSYRPLRIFCLREFQTSIRESVHANLVEEAERMDLRAPDGSPFYSVTDTSITGCNGTEFIFMGLARSVRSLKSMANIDIAWVEEATTISEDVWKIFEPSVRRSSPHGPFEQGSEIWISFNPELDTDETYKRWVVDPPKEARLCEINYWDNPFFEANEMLQRQMARARERGGEDYDNIWCGKPRMTLGGAIYATQIKNAEVEGRITDVPWDKTKPVNTYWDLGKRDHTCIWFIQPVGMYFNVIDFHEGQGLEMADYTRILQSKPYTYGIHFLPHDGENETVVTNRTAASILRSAGYRVRKVDRVKNKHISITASRAIFDQCRFDRDRTYEGMQRLRRYKYEMKDGNYTRDPLHDTNSDAADAFQQLGLHQKIEDDVVTKKISTVRPKLNLSNPGLGWMTS